MNLMLITPGGVDKSGRDRVIPFQLDLIRRLAADHALTVVALRQYPEPCRYDLLGARVVNLGMGRARRGGALRRGALGRQLRWLRQLRALFAAHGRPDCIHALWGGDVGLLAGLAGRLHGIPVLLSLLGGELVWLPDIGYGMQGSRGARLQVRAGIRLAAALTTTSHTMLRLLPAGRSAALLPLGVDTARFDGPAARPPGPPWRLLQVATINAVKDPPLLLHALACLRSHADVHLDWIGEDTLDGRMHALARDLGVAAHVTFHGLLPHADLPAFYRRAHLYVQSSRHESYGVAVNEAAACGLPTVGTAVGLVADLAPAAAVAVSPGSPDALAAAVLDLLRDAARRTALGRAAQTWARTHDADWTAGRFAALYEQLR